MPLGDNVIGGDCIPHTMGPIHHLTRTRRPRPRARWSLLLVAALLVGPSRAGVTATPEQQPSGAATAPADPVVLPPNPQTDIEVSLADFLREGSQRRTAYDAMARALAACRERRAARLVIPPGRYDFDDPVIASEPSRPHILFRDLEDLVVDAQGAEFVFHYIEPDHDGLHFVNCRRLAVRNLVVDWDQRLASAGIVEKVADGRTSIRILDDTAASPATTFESVSRFDLATSSWHRGLGNFEINRPRNLVQVARRTFVSPDFASLPDGAGVIVRHYVYMANAFTVDTGCSDISFEHDTVYAAPGEGFVIWNAESGFRLSHCTITRRPGTNRVYSTTADGANFNNLRGNVIVEHCDFGFQGDDAVNIHATLMVARSVVDTRTVVLDTLGFGNVVTTGDRIRLIRDFDFRPYQTLTVVSVTSLTPRLRRVTFDANLPAGLAAGDRAVNMSRSCAGYVVRDNVFHDNRARGILVQSPNGLVANNRVERVQMAGLQVTSSDTSFHEGPGCTDLVVRNNVFVGCNYGSPEIFQAGTNMACVNVTASVKGGLSPAPVHRTLTIDGNSVVDTPGLAFLLASCDGVTFTNNTAERANTVAWATLHSGEAIFAKAAGSLMVTRASRVAVGGYRELVFSGTTDKGIFVDSSTTSAVTVRGNTQGWIVPAVDGALAMERELRIEGRNFDGMLKVLVNGRDQTSAVSTRAPGLLTLKGSTKKLGLKTGQNTVQVINPLETRSNVLSFTP